MNIGILIFSKPKQALEQALPGTAALVRAGKQHGHVIHLFYEPLLTIRPGNNSKGIEVLYENKPFPVCDAVIPRPNFLEEPSLHITTIEALTHIGVPLLNGKEGFLPSKNKLAQKLTFTKAGIPVPPWSIVRAPECAADAATVLGFPLILKVPFGRGGKGVFYVENQETLLPLIDYLNIRDRNPVIMETFIKEAGRSDRRAFVIGGRIIAAMERTAKSWDIRANIHSGGSAQPIILSPEEETLAIRAAAAFDLEIAGVDLIPSKHGSLILEVNPHPGFETLSEVTGIDVADAIIKYVEQRFIHVS
ncbi:MAG: Alpha-L-glutamate ligase, RimK family [Candidatus Uhrbacteria bacterium GW2011_GWF2_41_16]|uniref:Alpha-L-glutamate ligase, RimK family n=2 Tax=Candidatus Uhriibacteriota TaxID=1752732 RepID=A0A0G0V938_9BACT|nr:MAG: Alpha-L-glutamate ligase, RimK family [Candidatus Uhrbacteria bacterium GW2011_GWC2_41_11]KKR97479.1 MAG: Alpha-L-glutamate ligase, RimK family [Candidatus Uhrbacteria bacterium GW2011_GWF2_41_16]HBP00150.1 hypothetical protein [Candidatus Uhrbacteria bacterium]